MYRKYPDHAEVQLGTEKPKLGPVGDGRRNAADHASIVAAADGFPIRRHSFPVPAD
jgi:hypothetical protein